MWQDRNCFIHCGFATATDIEIEIEDDTNEQQLWARMLTENLVPPNVPLNDYISVDDEAITSPNLDEFVVEQFDNENNQGPEPDEEQDDMEVEEIFQEPTFKQCFKAIEVLKEKNQIKGLGLEEEIEKIEKKLSLSSEGARHQTSIRDYFHI